MLRRWAWCVVLLLCAGACRDRGADGGASATSTGDAGPTSSGAPTSTSTTGDPPTSTGAAVDLGGAPGGSLRTDYCEPLAALICGRLAECGCGALLPSEALDLAGCAANYSARCLEAYAPLSAAVELGEAEILGDEHRRCGPDVERGADIDVEHG